MNQATAGNTVHIHYTGKLEDGTVFDSSVEREPLEFTLGSGQIIPGLDNAIAGMKLGESKQVTIEPVDAYGHRDENNLQSVPKASLPDDLQAAVGMQLQSQAEDGRVTRLVVTEVKNDSITVDANHPLAGQVLQFDVEVVKIE